MAITQIARFFLDVMEVKVFEVTEEASALLESLAMGNKGVEQGKFRDAEAVFGDLGAVALQ